MRNIRNPLSRREVLKFGAYTTVGGVLTPGISLAQAIVTDTKGITARDIQLNVGGTMIAGYDARPEAMGRYPVIVIASNFQGLGEHSKDVVRRFAKEGFFAIAPELFHREGGMQGKNFQEMGRISGGLTRAQLLGDIKAAADYAKQQSWARADRLGATGFCGCGSDGRRAQGPVAGQVDGDRLPKQRDGGSRRTCACIRASSVGGCSSSSSGPSPWLCGSNTSIRAPWLERGASGR